MTILDELANYAKYRVELAKKEMSLEEIKAKAEALEVNDAFPFEKAIRKEGLSYIAEVKRASPSKGLIAADFDYIQIAKEYDEAKVDAMSVLTEPKWFLGSDQYLQEIAKITNIPILRKDVVVDEYMIYQAKLLGASAILLIVSILDAPTIQSYLQIAHHLGLSAVVECHNEDEIQVALSAKARIIGVNNRNLKDFSVDTNNSARLRNYVSQDVLFISESGILNREDILRVEAMGCDGVLIGEALMKSPSKIAKLNELKGIKTC